MPTSNKPPCSMATTMYDRLQSPAQTRPTAEIYQQVTTQPSYASSTATTMFEFSSPVANNKQTAETLREASNHLWSTPNPTMTIPQRLHCPINNNTPTAYQVWSGPNTPMHMSLQTESRNLKQQTSTLTQ